MSFVKIPNIFQFFFNWRNLFFILLIGLSIYACISFFVNEQEHIFYQTRPLILLYTHNRSLKTKNKICRGLQNGGHIVNFDRCPRKCEFSCRLEDFNKRSPQAVLFFGEDFYWPFKLTDKNHTISNQRWIFWSWEAPIHHREYTKTRLTFNWTMTYRQDSDIVHSYGRYLSRNLSYTIHDYQSSDYYLSSNDNQSTYDIKKEFSVRKNRILWFVSNCKARTKRNQIAKELKNYFPLDQYGHCSNSKPNQSFEQLLFQYKFYLAFENAHCREYITEKAFYNSLAHGSIPIVLGPKKKDYEQLLPPNSFIYVEDFKDLKLLANQLESISKNFEKFSFYHQWRTDYRLLVWSSSYLIDNVFCNLCMKLYNDKTPKTYSNFPKWLNQCK